MIHKPATAYDWILNPAEIERLLSELCFHERAIQYVCHIAQQIAQSDEVPEFLGFCNSWQTQVKQALNTKYSPQWQALAAVSAFPEAIEKHRARGVPWKVTQATLADFVRRMDENDACNGKWEFSSLSWMRNHVSGNFFEINRLQYIPALFGYFYRVYRDRKTNEITTLALPGLQCTPEGWRCDHATGFETVLEERPDGIYGHPASASNGAISPALVKIAPDSQVLLDDRSGVVQIHIPWGGKLERETCVASLKEARVFFEEYFPEISVRAFCTATWLLDPELRKVLSSTSNIVSFGRLFRPIALRNGNEQQLLERVFGRDAHWDNCAATNSLQKAVLKHHQNGGQFRSGAGFILAEEIEAL